jgi:NADH dehydrogenase (ubiquinone) 1 beta subcomplex subunit 7
VVAWFEKNYFFHQNQIMSERSMCFWRALLCSLRTLIVFFFFFFFFFFFLLFVEMIATQEEMNAARVPLAYRDYCAHLLIPLNECRVETYYAPWKCTDLRHAYEQCQYDDYLRRLHKKMEADKKSKI